VTSPTSVGQVSVEVVAELRSLVKDIRKRVEEGLRNLDVGRRIRDSIGQDPISVPVEMDVDTSAINQQLRNLNGLRVPVEVEPETGSFAGRLRSQLARVTSQVRSAVTVDVDVDQNRSSSRLGSLLQGAVGAAGAVGGALTGAAGAAGSLLGALGPVVGVVGAIAAGLTLLPPLLAAAAGAAAAIPGAMAGIGAAVGTLALGFKGISEAFKPSAGGGGGGGGGAAGQAANQARQIASASRQVEAARRGIAAANRQYLASLRSVAAAERGLVAAQRAVGESQDTLIEAQQRAIRSQEAVNRARREAREDIEDLGRALRGAVISEAEAAQAVNDALFALNEAKLTGDLKAIARASNAYDRSVLSLEDAKDSVEDLTEESQEFAAKGVEGSDKVQGALEDQVSAWDAVKDAQQGVRDAQNGVIDATDSLISAQDGVKSALDGQKSATDGLIAAQESLAAAQQKVAAGSGGVAKEVIKLAPAAQRFVNAIKALKPAFENLRLDVQQRLFEGLDKTVTRVGEAWIPRLRETLGSYADTFNGFFKNLGKSITTPKFMDDIQAGAEGFRQLLDKLGASITTSLVPAFGALSKAAGPFLSKLGDELAGIVTEFSNWVLQGEKTGGLESFFDKAAKAMHDIFDIGRSVGSIIASLFEIITGDNTNTGKTPLESFKQALDKVAVWLKDPDNQQRIRQLIDDVKEAGQQFLEFANTVRRAFDRVQEAFFRLQTFIYQLSDIFGLSGSAGGEVGKAISGAVTGNDGGSLVEQFREGGRNIIDGLIEGIEERLGQFSIAGLLWEGPDSLLGRIRAGFGIASPSTVMAEVGRNLIDGLVLGIGEKFGQLVDKVREIPDRVRGALSGAGTWLQQHGQSAINGLSSGVSSRMADLRSRAGQARTTVQNALSNAGTWLSTHGRNAIIGLANGMTSWFGNLRAYAGNARVTVQNALANAGSWLVNHGRAVISGLMQGISSMFNTLGSFLGGVGRFIQANKGPIEKDRVLLRPAGAAIMSGLITGIADRKSALAAELSDVTSIVAGTNLPALGADMDASIRSSLSVADNKTITAEWKTGSSGDPVLDSLRDMIGFRFRGDPVAALSS